MTRETSVTGAVSAARRYGVALLVLLPSVVIMAADSYRAQKRM